MARKNQDQDQGNGAVVYNLVKGRRITVTSEVRSLKVPTGATAKKVDVALDYLHVDNDPKKDYKFARSATIPCLPANITDDNVIEAITQFMQDLRDYDAATELVAMVTVKLADGTKEDREIRAPRTIKLCAEYDKNGTMTKELSVGEYLARCIMGEHTLGLQKRFYKANMPKALEAAYNGELGTRTDAGHEGEAFEKPPVKVQRTKKQGDEEMEDIQL